MSCPEEADKMRGKLKNEQQCFFKLRAPFAIHRCRSPIIRPVIDFVALPQINHLRIKHGNCEAS